MPWFKIDIDAGISDVYVIKAKNVNEAKKKAVKRFAMVSNFRFTWQKAKTREEAEEIWL